MSDQSEYTLIRFVRLREDLKPVDIYVSPTYLPISPDWLGISRVCIRSPRRSDVQEDFILHFFTDDGQELTWYQFETLEIALDQAACIVGVRQSEWQECCIQTNDDDKVNWAEVG